MSTIYNLIIQMVSANLSKVDIVTRAPFEGTIIMFVEGISW